MERPKDHLSSPEQRLSSPTVVLKKKQQYDQIILSFLF